MYYDIDEHPKDTIYPHLVRASTIPKDEKIDAFLKLKGKLCGFPTFSDKARSNFEVLMLDFGRVGHTPGPNYDSHSNLFVDDLLYLCFHLVNKRPTMEREICEELTKQLSRMPLEASQRVNHLFQVVASFEQRL